MKNLFPVGWRKQCNSKEIWKSNAMEEFCSCSSRYFIVIIVAVIIVIVMAMDDTFCYHAFLSCAHFCLYQDGWGRSGLTHRLSMHVVHLPGVKSWPERGPEVWAAQANHFLSPSFPLCKMRLIREMPSLCCLRMKWDVRVKLTAQSLAQSRMLPPWQVMCFLVNSLTPLPFSFAGGLAASGSVDLSAGLWEALEPGLRKGNAFQMPFSWLSWKEAQGWAACARLEKRWCGKLVLTLACTTTHSQT